MVRENLDRLGLKAELVVGDAATFSADETFDAVLLDAPCSSTGTIRRHPDIPYTKSPKDIEALAALQARLLDNAVELAQAGRHARLFDLLARARGGRGADRSAHGAEQRAPPRRDRQGRSLRERPSGSSRRAASGLSPMNSSSTAPNGAEWTDFSPRGLFALVNTSLTIGLDPERRAARQWAPQDARGALAPTSCWRAGQQLGV